MAPGAVHVSSRSWEGRPEARLYRLTMGAFEAALAAADPAFLVRKSLRLEGETLFVRKLEFDLGNFDRVFVLGGGKATGRMTEEVEAILGDRITDGVVVLPDYFPIPSLKRVKPYPSTHPLPSASGRKGVRAMLEVADEATDRDLCICLFSGGGSALMPFPAHGLRLADKIATTKILLRCGATIGEMNLVRGHLSAFKGGRLAERLFGSTVLSLIISDVPGPSIEAVSSGPTAPDATTFAQARAVLERYRVWKDVPDRVRSLILKGVSGEILETPKPGSSVFANVHNVLIGSNRDAAKAAHAFLRRSGVLAVLRDGFYQGAASAVGRSLALELNRMRPKAKSRPFGIIAGGEATVRVRGGGTGGRDQELVLSAARFINRRPSIFAAFATDGVDGPSGAAGAVADSNTILRGHAIGLSEDRALKDNDSNTYFAKLGDLLVCPPTRTNVNDLVIALSIHE